MDTPNGRVIDHRRQALTFMLDALGLKPASAPPPPIDRARQLEQTVAALLHVNRGLRTRLRELERAPEEADLDAWECEMESRLAGERAHRDEGGI